MGRYSQIPNLGYEDIEGYNRTSPAGHAYLTQSRNIRLSDSDIRFFQALFILFLSSRSSIVVGKSMMSKVI